jgi:cytosine deaminase
MKNIKFLIKGFVITIIIISAFGIILNNSQLYAKDTAQMNKVVKDNNKITVMNSDKGQIDEFMQLAIEEAKKSLKEGGIPIGSVLVRNGKVISKGYNRRVQDNDPLAHAEMVTLKKAGRFKNYKDTVLYSTLMPCYMCAGTIVQFGIKKVVACDAENFKGAEDFLKSHGVEVVNINNNECKKMMKNFIEAHKDLWNEDIGK